MSSHEQKEAAIIDNKIDYHRWWILKNGRFYEETVRGSREITEEYVVYPGTTTDLELKWDDASEGVARSILDMQGSWSIVYFSPRLKKLFVGRDVFGRQSLVFNLDSWMFGVRVKPGIAGKWVEVPFGQVTVLDLESKRSEIYSYLKEYPDETKEEYFPDAARTFVNSKENLLNLSRATGGEISKNAEKLVVFVIEATKILLRNYASDYVAVCLSGGVDSTLIAHVAHKSVGPEVCIDLVNVAFGNTEKDCELAPDRGRSRKVLQSLRTAYPSRRFRLILVNVHSELLDSHRVSDVVPAVQPASSVLDDSLACVLWFAVRAEGVDSDTGEPVKSPAGTCLLGSGADELLAGYARHRTRFEKERIPENVAEECENELRRLGSRNGGRDARVAAQLGKTILSPLLEDSVVSWLNHLPVDSKWDLSLPRGIGEKLLLRTAVKQLGSPHDAPKQAMQFGSRMAKMSNNGNNAIKGSDKSPHLN